MYEYVYMCVFGGVGCSAGRGARWRGGWWTTRSSFLAGCREEEEELAQEGGGSENLAT